MYLAVAAIAVVVTQVIAIVLVSIVVIMIIIIISLIIFVPIPLQVTSKVVERKSFMSGVYHVLLPQRQKRYDFTFAYERAITEFSMAKPALRPRWQSLYYPLDESVWLCILALLALTPLFALLVSGAVSLRAREWLLFKAVLACMHGSVFVIVSACLLGKLVASQSLASQSFISLISVTASVCFAVERVSLFASLGSVVAPLSCW